MFKGMRESVSDNIAGNFWLNMVDRNTEDITASGE